MGCAGLPHTEMVWIFPFGTRFGWKSGEILAGESLGRRKRRLPNRLHFLEQPGPADLAIFRGAAQQQFEFTIRDGPPRGRGTIFQGHEPDPPALRNPTYYKEEHLYLRAAYSRLFTLSSYFHFRKRAPAGIRVLAESRVNS